MPDIFLSYSRDDQATARRFAENFAHAGLSVWWDQTLKAGEAFDEVTEKALNEAGAVVVLWSKASVISRWVRAEATQANDSGKLIPVTIEACKRPIMFELTHTADLSQWKGDASDAAWCSFVDDVAQFVKKDAARAPSPAAAQVIARHPKRISSIAIALAAAALLITGVVLWAFKRAPNPDLGRATPAPASAPTATATATAKDVSLAVLPFTNLSDDPRQEYFADGLTEEILNQLAQVHGLQLTARTSSFSFKGRNEDVRVIGKQLGVDNLLEGSVRKDGNQLRITAQLVNSRDGSHLWSQTYARQMSDIFAIQEDIAKDVAQALSVKLDIGEIPRSQGGTTNVAAYEKYVQGKAFEAQGGSQARGEAVRLFREAVELDPSFSLAWFELYANLQLSGASSPENADTLGREASMAATRLEQLSPDSWWYKTLVAYWMFGQHKWAEGVAAARASEAAAPASAVVCQPWSSMLLGRVREALACAEREHRSNPLSLDSSQFFQSVLDSAGRPAEAQAEYERSKDWPGDHGAGNRAALARALAVKEPGDATVKAQFRRVLQNNPDPLIRALFSSLEDAKGAKVVLRRAFEDPENQQPGRMTRIAIYADRFGDRDLALAALHRDLLELHDQYSSAAWSHWKTGLRADPRFKDILRGLGLVDYYRASGNWGDFCKPMGTDDFECQ